MSAVFISYRRADSKHFTGRMYDRLRSELGRDAVFKDVDSIPAGSDFPTVLNERLSRCQVALVIIGRDWTDARETDGTRRLDNPNDFVRIEVETVLRRGIPVIPVLIDGADFPAARDLPASLRELLRRNAVEVEDDPRFDTDMARLARTLTRLLTPAGDDSGAPVEAPAAPPAAPPVPPRTEQPPAPAPPDPPPAAPLDPPPVADSSELVGRDRAWPEIARAVSKGQLRVVLTGPEGIGKTSTARAFALWHSRGVAPLVIDATAEFDELTLIETVGRAFPHELYREHEGVPFVALPFGTQRQLAIRILVRHRAAVIIDNPGRAEYPRDPTAEARLAGQLAAELASKSVLVLVATALLTGWEDCNPIALQGLSPEHGRELVRGVLAGGAKPCSVEEAAGLGGPDEFERLLERGNPRELIRFAERAANALAPRAATGGLGRAGGWLKRAAEAVLGDPVHPTPRAGREGPGLLFAACIAMLLVALAALIWSYESGSRYWERMFYRVATRESDVPPLPAAAKKVSPGSGLLIEFARAVIVIIFFFLAVIGRFFAHELAALRPRAPWADEGPRTLGLRSAFRLVFLALAVWLGYSTVVHHLSVGPRTLWMCNGNPYLQKHLEAGDAAKVRELQNRPDDAPDKMNAEPPQSGAPGYEQYRAECARPYLRYYPYSFIMFVLVGPTVLTVCFYSVCSSLWTHLILQPRRVECLADLTPLTEVENRVRHYKKTYAENVDKYLILLLLLLGCWSYHLWLDRYNLTESADDHTTLVLVVALTVWAGLFSVLLLAYQVLIRQAARRFPEGAPREEFEARHASFRFFRKTVGGSGYTWLCLIPVLISASWYAAAVYFGWQR